MELFLNNYDSDVYIVFLIEELFERGDGGVIEPCAEASMVSADGRQQDGHPAAAAGVRLPPAPAPV